MNFPTLRRVTSNGRYVAEIDGLRFIAILSVLLYHVRIMSGIVSGSFPHWTGTVRILDMFLNNGSRGVNIFFAISGMILGLPFARQRLQSQAEVRLKPYFLRRITRLEPPYIINLLIRAPLVMVAKHLSVSLIATHLAVSLFYMDWLVYHSMPLIHQPSWSLAVEVQFYLMAPLLAWVLYRRNLWARRLLSLSAIALTSYVAAHLKGPLWHDTWQLSILAFFQYFLAGMLAADIYLTVQPHLRKSVLWDIAGIPLWIAVFAVRDSLAFYLVPAMLLILIPAAFLGPMLGRFFRAPFISTVGGMCYSIYLTHALVYETSFAAFGRLMPHATYWSLFAAGTCIVIPLSLVAGTIFYVLIERPCMEKNWPSKLWARWKSPANASA